MKSDLSETLCLPKTNFQMRADLPRREPEMLKFWQENSIYKKVLKENEKKKPYIVHDGPPYANGPIHLGHALGKILKDIVVKFESLRGRYVPFVPGWDTHGLPTELKAKAKAGEKHYENLEDIDLRKICRETALEYLNIQREGFKRLGVFGDWDNPYITLNPEFEAKQIEVFAEMVRKNVIYQGLKPVYWCSDCSTALAEAEIEYKNDPCDSVFVKFKVISDGVLPKGASIVIWTTTTWTLPGNVAVCVHPDFDYGLYKSDDECFLIATKLAKGCFENAGIKDFSLIETFKGKNLEGIETKHPFLERNSVLICNTFVTLESGTGCVHIAPGHGLEDFEVCRKYEFDMPVPVNENGILMDEAGIFSGLSIDEANKKIRDYLAEKSLLFGEKRLEHSYPHCWRCKKPVIFRATKQWFCSVDLIKDAATEEIEKVKWVPEWGKERIKTMVRERSDWCISRQRKWGVPIPIFFCKDCSKAFIDYDVMMDISRVFAQEGSDSWFKNDASYFVHGKKCECGGSNFEKCSDIMDVWFDSGVTAYATLLKEHFPADLYLEGADQYRGWFQSSLLTSVASVGKAPYKCVLTHGWVVDEEGKKQSKSLGNVISPQYVTEKFGADVLRLWFASIDYTADVRVSENIIEQAAEIYRKIRNTARFMLGNLFDFSPDKNCTEISDTIDMFILSKIKVVIEKCCNAYENFEFSTVVRVIQNFCITDLSGFYLDVIKDRLYADAKSSKQRRSAQTVLYEILNVFVVLIAPILPFTAEEIYSFLPGFKSKSVFLCDFPIGIKNGGELVQYWEEIIKLCADIKKELESARKEKFIGSSLEAAVVVSSDEEWILSAAEDIKRALIVSELRVEKTCVGKPLENYKNISVLIKKATGKKCDRCWNFSTESIYDEHDRNLCPRCRKVFATQD
jgi:isoleucyl-tRNA synthetase